MTSTLHFGDAKTLDSISTTASAGSRRTFFLQYSRQADPAKPWSVTITSKDDNKKLSTKEPFVGLYNQALCAQSGCSDDEFERGIPNRDDLTDPKTPYGLQTTPDSLPATRALMAVKNILAAQKGVPAFKSTCEALGGKAPEDVAYYSDFPNSSGAVVSTDASHLPSIR